MARAGAPSHCLNFFNNSSLAWANDFSSSDFTLSLIIKCPDMLWWLYFFFLFPSRSYFSLCNWTACHLTALYHKAVPSAKTQCKTSLLYINIHIIHLLWSKSVDGLVDLLLFTQKTITKSHFHSEDPICPNNKNAMYFVALVQFKSQLILRVAAGNCWTSPHPTMQRSPGYKSH